MKLKRGFTIVEVMVVIGIIAVLTVIIFPALDNIRKKNRDAERVADIAAIQLGLALYKNQNQTGEYPKDIYDSNFTKYITADSLAGPSAGEKYKYVPLSRSVGGKCTYYHLGTTLELPSAQIDPADSFSSVGFNETTDYKYCDTDMTGIDGSVNGNPLIYDVRP